MKKTAPILLFILLLLTAAFSRSVRAEDETFVVLPGDLLHISVWKEIGMDQDVLVLPDGTITFPLVGTLPVRGLSPAEIQAALRKGLESSIPDAPVTVTVQAPTGHKVSVIGQVQAPGEIILSARIGVMQALSQVGGLTPYADEDKIIVIRENPDGRKEKIYFPYDRIAAGKDLDKDIILLPGDVVVVPASGFF